MPKLSELLPQLKNGEVRFYKRASDIKMTQLEVCAHDALIPDGRGERTRFKLERVFEMPRDVHIRFDVLADDWEEVREP